MDSGEPFIVLTSALVVTFVLPLVILLQPQAIEVLLQHVVVLELMGGPSLVVRAGLLQHLVKNRPLRGDSSLLALDRSDKIIVEGLAVLSFFLLIVVVFWAPYWDPRRRQLAPSPCRSRG